MPDSAPGPTFRMPSTSDSLRTRTDSFTAAFYDDETSIDIARAVGTVAERLDVAPAQLALRWVIDRPGVTSTLVGADSPDQIDSWNRTWTFFDWYLRPYEDRSKPKPVFRVQP